MGLCAARYYGAPMHVADEEDPIVARSLTIKLPSPRRSALLAGALILIVVGAFIGVRLGASLLVDPLGKVLADGDLHEIQLVNGAVFVGQVVQRGSEELLLRDGAVVRQVSNAEGSQADIVVQALFADPYGLGGDVSIATDHVVTVGTVDASSSLAAAYREALGISEPAPAPSH
jgi:hypothetical protein